MMSCVCCVVPSGRAEQVHALDRWHGPRHDSLEATMASTFVIAVQSGSCGLSTGVDQGSQARA
eukprot:6976250-Alexandrium_andersonii.AAC.1